MQRAKAASQLAPLSVTSTPMFRPTTPVFPDDALGAFVSDGGVDILTHVILSYSTTLNILRGLRCTNKFWKTFCEKYTFSTKLVARVSVFVLQNLTRRIMTTQSRGYFRSAVVKKTLRAPATDGSPLESNLTNTLCVTGTPNYFVFPIPLHRVGTYSKKKNMIILRHPDVTVGSIKPRNHTPLLLFRINRRLRGNHNEVLPLAIDIYSGTMLWHTSQKKQFVMDDTVDISCFKPVGNVYTNKFSFRKYFTTNLYPRHT